MEELTQLTQRQTDVVRCIMLGLSGEEIASELGISLQTQKHHVMTIGKKMGIDRSRYMLRARIVYLVAPYWLCSLFRLGASAAPSCPDDSSRKVSVAAAVEGEQPLERRE